MGGVSAQVVFRAMSRRTHRFCEGVLRDRRGSCCLVSCLNRYSARSYESLPRPGVRPQACGPGRGGGRPETAGYFWSANRGLNRT